MSKAFEKDILEGLSAREKHISSKYLYDDLGSQIFQEIMNLDEYYPTNCELEILKNQSNQIFQCIQPNGNFNIVEFGAGDGAKTIELINAFPTTSCELNYIPIDISEKAIDDLKANITRACGSISINPIIANYFKLFESPFYFGDQNLLLFLGGNIGNFTNEEVKLLLERFNDHMNIGDHLLIGFDLRKNPRTVHLAYDDPKGVTRKFNLNLLTRINRELEGDFNLESFDFYCQYDPVAGEVRSYLVSLKDQEVNLKKASKRINFQKHELIHTELSRKFSLNEIEEQAQINGFKVVKHFKDSKGYFADSLWVKA